MGWSPRTKTEEAALLVFLLAAIRLASKQLPFGEFFFPKKISELLAITPLLLQWMSMVNEPCFSALVLPGYVILVSVFFNLRSLLSIFFFLWEFHALICRVWSCSCLFFSFYFLLIKWLVFFNSMKHIRFLCMIFLCYFDQVFLTNS
jgi:hypothetical protein